MTPIFDPMKREREAKADRMVYCPFPKHEGETWADVLAKDKKYIIWLVSGDCALKIEVELLDHLMDLLENDAENFDAIEEMWEDPRPGDST